MNLDGFDEGDAVPKDILVGFDESDARVPLKEKLALAFGAVLALGISLFIALLTVAMVLAVPLGLLALLIWFVKFVWLHV